MTFHAADRSRVIEVGPYRKPLDAQGIEPPFTMLFVVLHQPSMDYSRVRSGHAEVMLKKTALKSLKGLIPNDCRGHGVAFEVMAGIDAATSPIFLIGNPEKFKNSSQVLEVAVT